MKICLLASGSSGNCAYLEAGGTGILIDAGIPLSRITRELAEIGSSASSIRAILITHEHTDHTRELTRVAQSVGCPVMISRRTLGRVSQLVHYQLELRKFEIRESFAVDELHVETFSVFHDAVEPCGFLITGPSDCHAGSVSFGLATDLGAVTPPIEEALRRCHGLAIESNHDVDMLNNGTYPWDLKQRIRSPIGHLSNIEAAKLLARLAQNGNLRAAFLAHISEHNNTPELAMETARSHIDGLFNCEIHLTYHDKRSNVVVI